MNTFGQPPHIIHIADADRFELYQSISPNYSHSFLFESLSGPGSLAEISIMGFDPKIVVSCYADHMIMRNRDGTSQTIHTDDPLVEIRKLLADNTLQKQSNHRYLGGAVGVINYEAISLFGDVVSSHKNQEPLLEFGIYDDGIIYDKKLDKPFYFYYSDNRFDKFKKTKSATTKFSVSDITPNMNKDTFEKMVTNAKDYIYAGDIFQVVLSRRHSFKVRGDHMQVYDTMRRINPSPYMYHLKNGSRTILGASPEMLVRITDDTVETFPIAGTRAVTGDHITDESSANNMLHDEKELAEHTMLVDLGRNDIGKVCKYGTVKIPSMMSIKKFSHVQHMVTHVMGTISSKFDMYDAFKSIFPAGTVSGSPKIRAMEIIDELEPQTRGPYAGAIGYFSYTGCCDFAIAIRSMFLNKDDGYVQAGAGIVSDSVPENEFQETINKVEAMLQSLREASL